MNETPAGRLYSLLPAYYRGRDAEMGSPLRGLLGIIEGQALVLERNIEQLAEDLFIETCDRWVIPYIGDLVDNDQLFDRTRLPRRDLATELFPDLAGPSLIPQIVRTRADVAKTVYYRRRKGTPPMLEELARDVTGWPAHVVEFLDRLGWTQHVEHARPGNGWTDVRSVERMDRIDGAFDETSHTIDVRRPAQQEGWYHPRKIGFFLWRLESCLLRNVPARRANSWRFHFSPLGNPAPLFVRARREAEETALATELHLPGPIRRAFFAQDLDTYRKLPPLRPDATALYGPSDAAGASASDREPSLFIVRNGFPVLPAADPNAPESVYAPQIICRRLDPWPSAQPVGQVIAIDVESGRIAVGDGWGDATDTLDVDFHGGSCARFAGGSYDRDPWLLRRDGFTPFFVKEDGIAPPGVTLPIHTSVSAALTEWQVLNRPDAVISILDSRTYQLNATITLPDNGVLVLEASNRERPLLRTRGGQLEVAADSGVGATPEFGLSGVVLEGGLHVTADLRRLRVLHSTLIPGRALDEDGDPVGNEPSLLVEGGTATAPINALLRIEAAFSILGPLRFPEHGAGLWLMDCIVDGLEEAAIAADLATSAAPCTIERSTLFGEVRVRSLEASESIFNGIVTADRVQEGCVRFSYLPPDSRTARRYRCQPALAAELAIETAVRRNPLLTQAERDLIRDRERMRVVPSFSSTRYGHSAYGQLRPSALVEIRTGSEEGTDMGIECHLKQAQRESNLRTRLREYLPFGLDAGIVYVT